ncbi:hypothetical protein LTR17_003013 [Elasticomyces elasticus]|nr:hypothetical protein LTR17_003013 [Elasticomyces elasticus]
MEMVSEDVEEGAIKAEEEDEEDEAGSVKPVKGEELGEVKKEHIRIKKEHIKIENEELVGVNEGVDVQRGDSPRTLATRTLPAPASKTRRLSGIDSLQMIGGRGQLSGATRYLLHSESSLAIPNGSRLQTFTFGLVGMRAA